jgi:hypothetical protein
MDNQGFAPEEIALLRQQIKHSGFSFLYNDDEVQSEELEFAHFFFVGKHEGKDVIFDAVMYTLQLAHSSKLYEMAEMRAVEKFPHYKPFEYDEDEHGNIIEPEEIDEEVEEFKAEIMDELEEEESVKVREEVVLDTDFEYGIGLEVSLNVDEITEEVIDKFVKDFNNGTLNLDPTMYSFRHDSDEDEQD